MFFTLLQIVKNIVKLEEYSTNNSIKLINWNVANEENYDYSYRCISIFILQKFLKHIGNKYTKFIIYPKSETSARVLGILLDFLTSLARKCQIRFETFTNYHDLDDQKECPSIF